MTTINTLPTTEKDTFWSNVEYNVNLLEKLVVQFENEYNNETNIIKKTNFMMLLLDSENQLIYNLQLLNS